MANEDLFDLLRGEEERRVLMSNSYKALQLKFEKLQETLEEARNHHSYSAKACPLCKYENGVFIECCVPHQELDQAWQELEAWRHHFPGLTYLSGDIVEVD